MSERLMNLLAEVQKLQRESKTWFDICKQSGSFVAVIPDGLGTGQDCKVYIFFYEKMTDEQIAASIERLKSVM